VVDVRSAAAFGAGHLPGALHVGLRGEFATWCGTLLDPAREILLVTEDAEQVKEAVTRLARVGLENVAGHLAGGIAAWDRAGRPLEALAQMPVDELRAQIAEARPGLQVVDVRRSGEFASGHVPGAVHLPLDRLETALSGLDAKKPTVAICAGGYRSSIGAALLRRAGFTDVYNVVGGTSAWLAAGYPTA
jgi:hydroxyacylglutathione hydrolase